MDKPEAEAHATLTEEVRQGAHRERVTFSAIIHFVCAATLFFLLKHSDLAA